LKIRHGAIVEDIVTNQCTKFNYDRMRNGKVLGNRKYKNNNNNNARIHGPVSGSKIFRKPSGQWSVVSGYMQISSVMNMNKNNNASLLHPGTRDNIGVADILRLM